MEASKEVGFVHVEPIHRFIDGVYLREIFMPKNMIVVGRRHKFPHFLAVLSGRVWIDGQIYSGPSLLSCDSGAQRVLVACEDCSLMTIHANPLNLRDPGELFEHYSEAL